MKLIARYQADDGRIFETPEECSAHETRPADQRLVGLTDPQIVAALNGSDPALADAIESVGAELRKRRLERGGSKRKRAEAPAQLAAE